MEFPLFIAAAVTLIVLAILAHVFDAERYNAAWTLTAKRLGLSFPGDVINGSLDGVRLTAQVITRGVGKSRQYFTVVMVKMVGGPPYGMLIQREGVLDKAAKLIGAEDVQLGLPDLDPKLMVTGRDENKIRGWAQRPDVVKGLRRLVTLKSYAFELTSRHLIFERRGTMANADDLETLTRELVAVAHDLSSGAAPSSPDLLRSDDKNIW